MNQQIRELANNAANDIADQFTPGFFDDRMTADIADIIYKHHAKFAELIVRECARVIDRGDGEMSSMDETIWCNACRDDILQHFGVEG